MEATPTPGRERFAAARPLDRATIVRVLAIAVFLAIALFYLPTIGADWTTTFTSVAIYSVITLGLGMLYGRVGLISLGQVALLVVGVWTATRLNYAVDLPFPVLLLVTGAITCGVGMLIGLPAIRLSGLYLALITLMAAGAVNVVLVAINFPNGGGGFTGRTSTPDLSGLQPVRRPSNDEGDSAYYRYGCNSCHGDTGLGMFDLRKGHRDFPTDDAMIAYIRHPEQFKPGVKMPPWDGVIAEEDYAALAQHVRKLGAQASVVHTPGP